MARRKGAAGGWERELFNTTPLTKIDVEQLRPIFAYYDTDSDGALSPAQAALAFTQCGFPEAGAVSFVDFPGFCRLRGLEQKKAYAKGDVEGRLRLTFTLMNPKGAATLAAADLRQHCASMGVALSSEQAERICENICAENETSFTADAFVRFIKQQIALS
jgi:Ca2+-binding EF-hand superfamily protein